MTCQRVFPAPCIQAFYDSMDSLCDISEHYLLQNIFNDIFSERDIIGDRKCDEKQTNKQTKENNNNNYTMNSNNKITILGKRTSHVITNDWFCAFNASV